MKNIYLYIIGSFLVSCHLKNAKKQEVNIAVVKQYECDCKWQKIDTIFPNGNYIKVGLVDSICQVEIQIKNHKAILPKNYECPLNENLPKLFYQDSSRIEFYYYNRSGGYYITICELVDEKIVINWEEHTYRCPFEDCSTTYQVFVFKKPSDKTRIFCKGLFSNIDPTESFLENNKEERSFELPKAYWEEEIEVTELYSKHLLIKFKSGKELKLYCNL